MVMLTLFKKMKPCLYFSHGQRNYFQKHAVDQPENPVDRAGGPFLPNASQGFVFWDSVTLPLQRRHVTTRFPCFREEKNSCPKHKDAYRLYNSVKSLKTTYTCWRAAATKRACGEVSLCTYGAISSCVW